jgi:hypothetical protein
LVKGHFCGGSHLNAHLLSEIAHLKSLGPLFNKDGRHASVARLDLRIALAEDDDKIGDGSIRDESLYAIDQIFLPFFDSCGQDLGDIAPMVGFGKSSSRDRLPSCDGNKILLLLNFVSESQNDF